MKLSVVMLGFIFFLLVMPLITADIVEDTLRIKIYDRTTNDSMVRNIKIEFISSKYIIDNKNFTFQINTKGIAISNFSNFSSSINKVFGPFNYLVVTEAGEIFNIDYKTQYDTCIVEKGKFDMGWNNCRIDLEKYTGANATVCKDRLDTCNLTLKQKDIDISAKDEKITSLQTESEGTKNSKWIYGIGGVILGILGLLFYQGKLGRGVPRERSMSEFNKGQAG